MKIASYSDLSRSSSTVLLCNSDQNFRGQGFRNVSYVELRMQFCNSVSITIKKDLFESSVKTHLKYFTVHTLQFTLRKTSVTVSAPINSHVPVVGEPGPVQSASMRTKIASNPSRSTFDTATLVTCPSSVTMTDHRY